MCGHDHTAHRVYLKYNNNNYNNNNNLLLLLVVVVLLLLLSLLIYHYYYYYYHYHYYLKYCRSARDRFIHRYTMAFQLGINDQNIIPKIVFQALFVCRYCSVRWKPTHGTSVL